MTKLFIYKWDTGWSEDHFYIAADSLLVANKVRDLYLGSDSFYGKGSEMLESEKKRFKEKYKPKEVKGFFVEDCRRNHLFYEITDGAESDFVPGADKENI